MSRWLLTITALFTGALGVAASFAPDELLRLVAAPPTLAPFVQIAGALYLGFGLLDWMVRNTPVGGIYGRPIVVGNLLHFVAGGLALLKGGWTAIGLVYLAFGIAFWVVMQTSPRS